MMQAGGVLVGSLGDYDRPFRLEHDGTWDDVSGSIARQLIESGKLTCVADRGAGQTEYKVAAVPRYLFWAVLCKRQHCHLPILLKYLRSEGAYDYKLPPRPAMTNMRIPCRVCGEMGIFRGDDLLAVWQPLDSPPSDFVDQI
jgi:hypothetical protein